jgi:hypothetical protein
VSPGVITIDGHAVVLLETPAPIGVVTVTRTFGFVPEANGPIRSSCPHGTAGLVRLHPALVQRASGSAPSFVVSGTVA